MCNTKNKRFYRYTENITYQIANKRDRRFKGGIHTEVGQHKKVIEEREFSLGTVKLSFTINAGQSILQCTKKKHLDFFSKQLKGTNIEFRQQNIIWKRSS